MKETPFDWWSGWGFTTEPVFPKVVTIQTCHNMHKKTSEAITQTTKANMSPVESAYARYTEDKYSQDLGGQLVKAADLATLAANYGSEKQESQGRLNALNIATRRLAVADTLAEARYDAWMDAEKKEEDANRLLDLAKREIKHLEDTALETRNKRDKTEDSLRADLNASNRQVEELTARLNAIEARSLEISEIKKSQKDIGVINASTTGCHLVQFHPDANRALKPQPGERIAIIPAVAKTPVVDELQEAIDAVRAVCRHGVNCYQDKATGQWAVWAGGQCLSTQKKTPLDAWQAAKNNLPKPVSDDEKFVKEHYPNASVIEVLNGYKIIQGIECLATGCTIAESWRRAANYVREENEKKQLDADIAFVRKVFPSAKCHSSWGYHSVMTNGTYLSHAKESVLDSWKEARKCTEKMTLPPAVKV